jgi:hypothetical protein
MRTGRYGRYMRTGRYGRYMRTGRYGRYMRTGRYGRYEKTMYLRRGARGINTPVSMKDLRNLVAYYTINPTLINATDITILRRSLLYDFSYLYS